MAGFGKIGAEVNASLGKNELAFLQKCRQWNLKLNKTKFRWEPNRSDIHGTSFDARGPKAGPIQSGNASTDRRERTQEISCYSQLFGQILNPIARPDRTSEEIGRQDLESRMVLAGATSKSIPQCQALLG